MPDARKVSFIVLCYNQERFVAEAIKGALAQTYPVTEIIISDDASTDRTYSIVESLVAGYNGPHKVSVRRNEHNLGVNVHVNKLVSLARGDFIVIAAGDDISLPDRTSRLVAEWEKGAVGVFSNARIIDRSSRPKALIAREDYQGLTNWRDMVRLGSHGSWGCAYGWDRSVFDVFGDIPYNVLGEDAAIPFRCALLGKLAYIPEPLVMYREHGSNLSFWSRVNQTRGDQLRHVGAEYLHSLSVHYVNWIRDIEFAAERGLLDAGEAHQAILLLQDHCRLKQSQQMLLNSTYGRLFFRFPGFFLRALQSMQPRYWIRHTGSVLLQCRAPRLRAGLIFLLRGERHV